MRKRLAIIGGGMGGVATAWFCDREWSVSLFEARTKLGGNCDSETIPGRGGDFAVDLGAQYFHPETHPTYLALLDLLEETRSLERRRFEIPTSLALLPMGGGDPWFSSTNVMKTPLYALDFVVYCREALKMARGGDGDVTIAEWVDSLRVSRTFKSRILLPWLTATEGHPLEETKRSSARAVLQLFAPSHPRNPFSKPTTWSSRAGLQATISAMARGCESTVFQTQSPVLHLEKIDGGWFVCSKAERSGPFDAVVINAPPWESKKILGRLSWAVDLVSVLDRFEFLSHRLTVHTDPTYVHKERRNWVMANVGVQSNGDPSGESSELSLWLGTTSNGSPGKAVDVFKSWTSYRAEEPKSVLFERTFQHSIKTPGMLDASRRLRAWQGREGLWFAGHFTSGIDLQEAALRSAMDTASALCPSSANLAALERAAPALRAERATSRPSTRA